MIVLVKALDWSTIRAFLADEERSFLVYSILVFVGSWQVTIILGKTTTVAGVDGSIRGNEADSEENEIHIKMHRYFIRRSGQNIQIPAHHFTYLEGRACV